MRNSLFLIFILSLLINVSISAPIPNSNILLKEDQKFKKKIFLNPFYSDNFNKTSIDSALPQIKTKKKILIYGDINLGLLFNSHVYGGPGTSIFGNLCIDKFTFTVRSFTGEGNAPEAKETAIMGGINYRRDYIFLDVVAGIGNISYRCTNGIGQNCNGIFEGGAEGLAIQTEITVIATNYLGFGMALLSNINSIENYYGFLFYLKVGLLRSYD